MHRYTRGSSQGASSVWACRSLLRAGAQGGSPPGSALGGGHIPIGTWAASPLLLPRWPACGPHGPPRHPTWGTPTTCGWGSLWCPGTRGSTGRRRTRLWSGGPWSTCPPRGRRRTSQNIVPPILQCLEGLPEGRLLVNAVLRSREVSSLPANPSQRERERARSRWLRRPSRSKTLLGSVPWCHMPNPLTKSLLFRVLAARALKLSA